MAAEIECTALINIAKDGINYKPGETLTLPEDVALRKVELGQVAITEGDLEVPETPPKQPVDPIPSIEGEGVAEIVPFLEDGTTPRCQAIAESTGEQCSKAADMEGGYCAQHGADE